MTTIGPGPLRLFELFEALRWPPLFETGTVPPAALALVEALWGAAVPPGADVPPDSEAPSAEVAEASEIASALAIAVNQDRMWGCGGTVSTAGRIAEGP